MTTLTIELPEPIDQQLQAYGISHQKLEALFTDFIQNYLYQQQLLLSETTLDEVADQVDIPEEPLLSLKIDVDQFKQELTMLAAVKLFELGRLSSGRAAQLAGRSRVAFLMALKDYQVSPFQLTAEELAEDVKNA